MDWIFWKKWHWIKEKYPFGGTPAVKEVFHLLTTTLLSLLLPLSFLLLARLSAASAHYHRPRFAGQPLSTAFLSMILPAHLTLLYTVVSFISIATLLHSLKGQTTFSFSGPIHGHRPHTSWILLCTLHVCVGLGIEGSIATGDNGYAGNERALSSKLIFIIGLHETMLHWFRMVVKLVVDDTVFGDVKEESWVEKAAMTASFGGFWWWRLREEAESLVMVDAMTAGGSGVAAEIFGWWLYYLTVTIGMVRIVKGLIWVAMVLVSKSCRKVEKIAAVSCGDDDKV